MDRKRGYSGRNLDISTLEPPSSRPWWIRHWVGLSFFAFLALAILFSIKTWFDPTHAWAGVTGDPEIAMNFLAWHPHALGAGHNPLFDPLINLPRGVNMMWDNTTPLPALVVWPINAAWGPIAAYNVALVAGLALDGWCSLLWLRRHLSNPLAVFTAALIMEFGPYTGSRAVGHLNLVLAFAFPLLLIGLEEMFFQQRWKAWRVGVFVAAAAAIQFLCAAEVLAIFVVVAMIILSVTGILFFKLITRSRIEFAGKALLFAVPTFLLITSVPLYYQFFGPNQVHGVIQNTLLYSNDLTNVLVPNTLAWFQLPLFTHLQNTAATGVGSVEANAFVGIPMLLIFGYLGWRWRRDRFVLSTLLVGVGAVILTLGPRLQIDGHVVPHAVLPGELLLHIPVFNNILPGRFGLAVDAAMALLFAIFLERHVFIRQTWLRTASFGGVAAMALVTLAPAPLPASNNNTPAYFTATGDVHKLPSESAVLVLPFYYGSSMLWQAEANFHIGIDEGSYIAAKSDGTPTSFTPGPIFDAYSTIEKRGEEPNRTASERAAVMAQLEQDHTVAVVVGPMPNQQVAVSFTTWLLESPPTLDQGVYVWIL